MWLPGNPRVRTTDGSRPTPTPASSLSAAVRAMNFATVCRRRGNRRRCAHEVVARLHVTRRGPVVPERDASVSELGDRALWRRWPPFAPRRSLRHEEPVRLSRPRRRRRRGIWWRKWLGRRNPSHPRPDRKRRRPRGHSRTRIPREGSKATAAHRRDVRRDAQGSSRVTVDEGQYSIPCFLENGHDRRTRFSQDVRNGRRHRADKVDSRSFTQSAAPGEVIVEKQRARLVRRPGA